MSSEPAEHLAESMQHVYTLRRGRTSAVVEAMEWAHDKLWFGMSTRKRTVHVFAVNPLGGRPDGSSHLVGKVVNSPELVSSSPPFVLRCLGLMCEVLTMVNNDRSRRQRSSPRSYACG